MANFREMYVKVFRSQTRAIEELEGIAVQLHAAAVALKSAQREAEAIYIDDDLPMLELLPQDESGPYYPEKQDE